jgi:amidase
MHSLDFLARLDGVAQASWVAKGELSAVDLIEACRHRLEAVDPLIHSVVSHDFGAARARAERGVSGPLGGVPFLFKDLVAYPGLRCSYGSRLFARNVATEGSPFTDRVDGAGLVTVGKSATSEFGLLGSTETWLEGVTHNPWNLALSATGSSGGAAAAVAAGIVPLAHASDGGGSIRIPASANGLFGLKPSRGRCVPTSQIRSEFDAVLSEGCISRSVRDSALFLSLVEAEDCGLPHLGHVREPIRQRLRIGAWQETAFGAAPHVEVSRAFDATVALCLELGHEVVSVVAPAFDGATAGRAFFDLAGSLLGTMMDLLQDALKRPLGAGDLEPFTRAVIGAARAAGPAGPLQVRAAFEAAAHIYLESTRAFDVVLTPVLATPPWMLGEHAPSLGREELLLRMQQAVCHTPIHNVAGCPAMSVPLYWTAQDIPIGSHFAAAPGREDLLLGLAYELEAALPWGERWAPHSFVRLMAEA